MLARRLVRAARAHGVRRDGEGAEPPRADSNTRPRLSRAADARSPGFDAGTARESCARRVFTVARERTAAPDAHPAPWTRWRESPFKLNPGARHRAHHQRRERGRGYRTATQSIANHEHHCRGVHIPQQGPRVEHPTPPRWCLAHASFSLDGCGSDAVTCTHHDHETTPDTQTATRIVAKKL